ncbi:MAG: glycosyltransferase [Novosphingobium sp.]|uniref:glycosyltransferase n=1 Tax=Novosphingobium sp. TaxID=1874826 RepID=UPI0032B974F9
MAEAVIAQAEIIRANGGEAVVFALEDEHSAEDALRYAPSQVHFSRIVGPTQIGFAPDLLKKLLAARLDCLHQQGIWMYPTRAGELWARRTGKPLVITPQGMLDPWITARGRWKKALARIGYERAAWRRAAFFHALTGREARAIEHEAGRSDSLVLPNVGPPVISAPTRIREAKITFIGRIHPKKNILALVAAWKLLNPAGAQLVIAGWGADEDVAELKAALIGAPASAQFVGPIFGEAKQQLLERSRFTILPSHSEGLPLSILESWAAATPSIMTDECNIPEGFEMGGAIECGYVPLAIAEAIAGALELNEPQWLEMAAAAHRLAAGPFSLETVGRRWANAYLAAIAGKKS